MRIDHRAATRLQALHGPLWLCVHASRGKHAAPVRMAVALAFAVVLIGAWACASLSVVDPRYLARDAWLLPMVVALGLWAGGGRGSR